MYKNYPHVGLLLVLIASDLLAAEAAVQFPPLKTYRGNWQNTDTYMSVSEATNDFVKQFEKGNSQYASCMAALDKNKPASCSRVDLLGAEPDSSLGTYNGEAFRYLIKVRQQSTSMDATGKTDTSSSEGVFGVVAQSMLCPINSAVKSSHVGQNYTYWCERNIPLVKKNDVCAGNPINIANGKKQQRETDFSSADGLVINRFYAGQQAGWQLMPLPRLGEGGGEDCQTTDYFKYYAVEDRSEVNFSARKLSEVTKPVCVQGVIKSADAVLTTSEGIPLEFRKDAADNYYSAQTSARLFRLLPDLVEGIKWRVIHPNGLIWEFDHQGSLRLSESGGRRIEYAYVNKILTKMTSLNSGKEVHFEYTDGLISKAITPDGTISYLYGKTGAISAPGMLRSVIAVDGSEL